MLRTLSITILILAGAVMVGLLLLLRLVAAMLYAVSGIRRRAACEQLLSW